MPPSSRTTRLAPSPTGDLHLGNVRTLLMNWAIARRSGWEIRMRIDDLDGDRCSPAAEASILANLAWLGIDHDGPVHRQTAGTDGHRAALDALAASGRIFSCDRSRRELRAAAEAAGAPHGAGTNLVSTARMRPEDPGRWGVRPGEHNHRLALEEGLETVTDGFLGERLIDLLPAFGDPILWTRRDTAAYHLANVVDDLEAGVTDVVRGEDLLPSAALHQRLARLLGGTPPRWWHLPLVLDETGRRLAKRDGDLGLGALRDRGVPPERIIGLMARTCGLNPDGIPLEAAEFGTLVELDRIGSWARTESAGGGTRLERTDLERLVEGTT